MHKAKALIISCIDFRIQRTLMRWLESSNYVGKYDHISIAGSLRDIVKPENEIYLQNLIRQLKISLDLHSPHEILVFDHQDCGGYASDNLIPNGLSKQEDFIRHKECAQKARYILFNEYEIKIPINFYYIDLLGNIESLI